jgi:alanine racemase
MRTWAEINLDAITENFNNIKKQTTSRIMAVIKADAYGHGIKEVASVLKDAGADYFGVATADEALELRKLGIDIDILTLGVIFNEDYHTMIENDICMTVVSRDDAEKMSEIAVKLNKKARIHIKLDTGMGRIGFVAGYDDKKILKEIEYISCLKGIKIEGIYSHMSRADEYDKTYSMEQFEKFKKLISLLEDAGIDIPIKHIANSAALLTMKETHLDMVRLGIAVYGLLPSCETKAENITLKPAMMLKTKVTHIKTIMHESPISYGGNYKAKAGQKIATIAIGYADGFSRILSGKAKVLVNGHFADVVGNICMDQSMIDVTHIDNINIGDEVIIFGSDGNNTITVDSVAHLLGTINYEVVCSVSRRVPRAYIHDNKIIAEINYLL